MNELITSVFHHDTNTFAISERSSTQQFRQRNPYRVPLPSSHQRNNIQSHLNQTQNMTDQDFHRKIELQSPDDLQYLVSNIRRATDAEIERSLPSLPGITDGEGLKDGKGDDMRVVVERLVGEVCLHFLNPQSPQTNHFKHMLTSMLCVTVHWRSTQNHRRKHNH